ncbi:hypothetical protein [Streptomyces sp. NPDC007905]|uniref:hypothetical protein n=1 Tax=Streptomyces sp. NPDC007905 TaxID=3364788 RepID=UPI0036EAC0D1
MYIPFTPVFFHSVTGLSFAVVGAVLTATGLAGLGVLPLAGTAGAAVDKVLRALRAAAHAAG